MTLPLDALYINPYSYGSCPPDRKPTCNYHHNMSHVQYIIYAPSDHASMRHNAMQISPIRHQSLEEGRSFKVRTAQRTCIRAYRTWNGSAT